MNDCTISSVLAAHDCFIRCNTIATSVFAKPSWHNICCQSRMWFFVSEYMSRSVSCTNERTRYIVDAAFRLKLIELCLGVICRFCERFHVIYHTPNFGIVLWSPRASIEGARCNFLPGDHFVSWPCSSNPDNIKFRQALSNHSSVGVPPNLRECNDTAL